MVNLATKSQVFTCRQAARVEIRAASLNAGANRIDENFRQYLDRNSRQEFHKNMDYDILHPASSFHRINFQTNYGLLKFHPISEISCDSKIWCTVSSYYTYVNQ